MMRIFSVMVLILTATFAVKDGSLYYESLGKGDAIIFLHGGFGDRRMWDRQFQEFARSYHVVRYDHRGFGKSPAPTAAYSPVTDLAQLMDYLSIEKAHLVGNSMGGALAIDFALLRPERVLSISVVASGPNGYPIPQEQKDRFNAVFTAAEKEGVDRAAEIWMKNPMVAVTSQLAEAAPLLRQMITENAGIFRMQHWPVEILDPPAAQRLAKIKVAALVVIGDKDTPLVQEIADAAAKGIPGAKKIVIEGADHLPQMDDPARFNRILKDFLTAKPPSK